MCQSGQVSGERKPLQALSLADSPLAYRPRAHPTELRPKRRVKRTKHQPRNERGRKRQETQKRSAHNPKKPRARARPGRAKEKTKQQQKRRKQRMAEIDRSSGASAPAPLRRQLSEVAPDLGLDRLRREEGDVQLRRLHPQHVVSNL